MTNLSLSHPENTPALSKVWNRGHGTGRVDLEIARGHRESGYRFSILLVQFDGLSRTTDRLGHASTDGVWRRVLGVLTRDLGAKDLCCRLGADEFLLVLPDRINSECRALVENLHRNWMPTPRALEAELEVSIGSASYPDESATVEGLLATGDAAMTADKDRNQMLRSTDPLPRVAPLYPCGNFAPARPFALSLVHGLTT